MSEQDSLLGDDDRPLTAGGPVIRALQEENKRNYRFRNFIVGAILVLGLSNTVGWYLYTDTRQEVCEERNRQIIASNRATDRGRAFLRNVTAAMHQDGDHNTAAALERYIDQASQAPRLSPVKC